jgi:hypothetical protein
MARPFMPIDEGTGSEIYNMIVRYAGERKVLPNPHALWKKVIVGLYDYPVSRGSFDYHWMRFQLAGLIETDPLTKAYRVANIDLVVKSS